MKKTMLMISGALAACSLANAQLLINQGDAYTHSFDPANYLPFTMFIPALPGENPFGSLSFTISGLDSGEHLRCEMFENLTSEAPIATGILLGPTSEGACQSDFAWHDAQGAIRITMVAGSATLESVTLKRLFPVMHDGMPSFAVFEGTVVPVPEPSVTTLGLAGFVIILCGAKRIFLRF